MQVRNSLNLESEEAEEGFDQTPTYSEEIVVEPSCHQASYSPFKSIIPSGSKGKSRYFSQEKPHLKLKALDPSTRYLKRSEALNTNRPKNEDQSYQREEDNGLELIASRKHRKLYNNSLMEQLSDSLQSSLIKTKRTSIGQNLTINDERHQTISIQQEIAACPQAEITYKSKIPDCTFTYFQRLLKNSQQSTFLGSKLNTILKVKLEKAKQPKEDESSIQKPQKLNQIEFSGDFESGNLNFAIKVSEDEYNVFLRIDTNTRGHQSWFYFKVSNWFHEEKRIRINICNVKRRFKMIEKGQKIHYKDLSSEGNWQTLDQDIEVKPFGNKKFKISFDLQLKPEQEILLSLIPPYTYSQLLKDIQTFQKSPNCKVEVLTHSITGLAVPLLTITKGAAKERKSKLPTKNKKKLMLLSGRIHPSETCSSFIISGLIHELLQQENVDDFLTNNIIKIVPMLNPDGVVFGNFRTNYLGDDLNRSFHRTDDTIYPETTALKQLGKIYKEEYGDNFVGFLDMHGHSSQTNSFVYGPEYEQNSDSFLECRVLPKIIDRISKYFKYEMSDFRLPNYKNNTARGYFLKKLKVPSYTIQTSYGLYRNKDSTEDSHQTMSIPEWTEYGREMAQSIFYYFQYLEVNQAKINIFRKPKENKNTLVLPIRKDNKSASCIDFGSLRKEIQKQTRKNKLQEEEESSDSDGESLDEDLPEKEKQMIILKIRERTVPSFLLPKVSKPSIVLPSVVPSILNLSKEDKNTSTMPKLVNKFRQKKLVRPMNLSYQYTQYLLKNITDIGSLRPEVLQFNYGKNQGLETSLKKNTIIDF